MNLLIEFMQREIEELHRQNVKIRVVGDYTKLPGRCVTQVEEACRITENNNGLIFNIAINYGARDEIVRAARTAAAMVARGEITADEITEKTIDQLLFTAGITDPDLLIRTAGEMRISNFLLWQIAYAELWFTDVLWPDFTREDLMQAIYDYQHRSRRFGGLN
jgi:undecaprenyl diphosphate synthase